MLVIKEYRTLNLIKTLLPLQVLTTIPTFTNSFLATNYTVERQGAVIKIEGDQDFSIRTEDGLANQGLVLLIKK